MRVFPQIGIRDLVSVNLSGDNVKLAYARISPTRKEIIDLVSYEIQGLTDEEITKSIRTSLNSLKLHAPEVVVTIPAHATIAKNIEIPSLVQQEIREIVDLQAGRHTPYSREEIIIDHINVGTLRDNYTKILLIIVTLGIVRRQIEILENAGLRIDKAYFAPEANARLVSSALKLGQGESVHTIVHIDSNFSEFINISKAKVIFVRSIPIGRHHLRGEPERYQIRFVEEIKKSLETYQSEDIGPMPEEIILTGAVREGDELQDFLGKMLFMPVIVFHYLTHAPMGSDELKKSLASGEDSFLDVLAPIISPGSSMVNLIPEEVKLRQKFEEKSKDLVTSGVYVLTILALLCLVFIGQIFVKSSYLKNLTGKYQPVIDAAKHLEKSFSQMRSIKKELRNRELAINVLAELYTLVPKDIQLTAIKFSSDGNLSIEGNSRTMGTVFSFIGDMEESGQFKSVESRRTTKRKIGDDEIVDFDIVSVLEQAGVKKGS